MFYGKIEGGKFLKIKVLNFLYVIRLEFFLKVDIIKNWELIKWFMYQKLE